jgi:hypothetical protein
VLNRLAGALSTLAAAVAELGLVAAQFNPGGRGAARARKQRPASWPVRARRRLGRTRPGVAKKLAGAKPFTPCSQIATTGSVSTTDWQGGIT